MRPEANIVLTKTTGQQPGSGTDLKRKDWIEQPIVCTLSDLSFTN